MRFGIARGAANPGREPAFRPASARSKAGLRARKPAPLRAAIRGVTLIEMLMVVTIVSLMVAVTFPSVSTGLDSIRLASATNAVAAFLNAGLNRAERRQEIVEITVSRNENTITMRSSEPGFLRSLAMPEGVAITAVLPVIPEEVEGERRIVLYPGGTVPRVGIEVTGRRGGKRVVRIDPATGVPQIERVVL